jgi:DNA-binding transcriptional regulator YiaG
MLLQWFQGLRAGIPTTSLSFAYMEIDIIYLNFNRQNIPGPNNRFTERTAAMPNLAQTIKAEVIRISRREIKASVNPLRSTTIALKKTVAELKRKTAALEAENKRLAGLVKSEEARIAQVPDEVKEKARITSKTVRKVRGKLGLSQADFATLLGISRQSAFMMEQKSGRLRLRPATLAKLLVVREMGKREALRRLEEIGSKK